MTAPEVGVLLTGEGMSLSRMVDYAISLEDTGFQSVWHEEIFREPFVPLAAIAARTKSIRLGAAVSTWSRTPVTSALTAANLDQLSHGRYVHGVGTGPPAWNEQYHGISYEHPVQRMREFIEVIRSVWRAHSGQAVSYGGHWYNVRDYSRPLRQEREAITLALAAVQRNMLRLAGSHADAVIFNVLTTKEYYRDYGLRYLAEGAGSAGRPVTDVERLALICVAVHEDVAQAREWARHQIAFFAVIPYFDAILGIHGFAKETAAIRGAATEGDLHRQIGAVSDEMVDRLTIAGTPAECRARLAEWVDIDTALLVSPTFGLGDEEIAANYQAIRDAFARR